MAIDFGGHRFEKEIILLNVRWKATYPLSYRDLEEIMAERGVTVDQPLHLSLGHQVHTILRESRRTG